MESRLRVGFSHLGPRRISTAPLSSVQTIRRRAARRYGADAAGLGPRVRFSLRQHDDSRTLYLHWDSGAFSKAAAGHSRIQCRLVAFLARPNGRPYAWA